MKLLLSTPTGILVDARVAKVVAEGDHGSFAVLPRHADVATPLVAGLLAYQPWEEGADEVFVAVDDGLLVKAGDTVRVASPQAVVAGDLGSAESTVRERFRTRTDRERRARSALLRLESDIRKRLGELRD